MLEVEQHEVTAGGLEDMAYSRRGELDDEVAEFRRSHCRHLLETVPRHFALPFVRSTSDRQCCLATSLDAPPHKRPAVDLAGKRSRPLDECLEPNLQDPRAP